MQRRDVLVRLGALGLLEACDLLTFVLQASAELVTVTVRLRLPSGFDSTATVVVDAVTVFERSGATCVAPGQTTVAHQLGATALTAFHRALEQFELPPNPCGAPYEMRYFQAFGSLYLGAVHCYREQCQVHGWVYWINGQQPGIGMDQQPIEDGDEIVVDFLPLAAAVPDQGEPLRPLQATVAPNPFDEDAEVRLLLPHDAVLSAAVYNISGQCVRQLCRRSELTRGMHAIAWDGTDDRMMRVPAGVYFIRITHHQTGDERTLKVFAR